MEIVNAIGQTLGQGRDKLWGVFWPLVLGVALSAMVQALVSHKIMAPLLGDSSPSSLTLANLFGIASCSCSYAAVALVRSIFRKGASFASVLVFEIASTNLVIELGIIVAVLLGWQFTVAEFLGGIVTVIIITLLDRRAHLPGIRRPTPAAPRAKTDAPQPMAPAG